ncbi:MAG TPA: transporter substrate-binding domain-containing protein [Castellaniella sp.]|uniref:transporter substrate-binding domain-containing protein n=1 Tax=Castellaniella sp. TaxID=1955812 RepID=UPI002F1FB90F
MSQSRLLSKFALLLSGCAIAFGVQANELQDIQKAGVIKIGVDITAPPYGMLDKDAKATGFDVDSARSLAKSLGVKLDIVPVTGPTRVQFLLTKKVDLVMASFSITPEREKVIDFSKPYGRIPVVVYGPKAVKIGGPKDLTDKAIAVTRGTTSDMTITNSTKGVAGVTIVRYQDDSTTNTAAATGKQKYIVGAPSILGDIHKVNPKADMVFKYTATSFPMGVGIRKDEPELKASVDHWVEANLKDGNLKAIYAKYFPGVEY